ncbi:hypothetical protein B0H10DRAFT_1811511 [Mycena sp. CBHHK59/15]|nr:hypothetical protein B0H10DRAFT_1811511 [Mycena sp. CBHHK59/15]
MLYWCIAMAETVVIAAQLGPQSALSQRLLTALAFGGHLGDVRFTMTPSLALGSLLIAGGAILRLQCYHALGRHFTFETGIFKNHVLVTTGPYSIVRHPSYTGAFLAFAGLLIYYGSPGSWVMECLIKGSRAGKVFVALYSLVMFLVVTGLTWRIPKEDEGLRNEFGKEWDTWAATVQYVLIPGIY